MNDEICFLEAQIISNRTLIRKRNKDKPRKEKEIRVKDWGADRWVLEVKDDENS